ncbi:MAG TPA: hypothetical protein VNZ64_24840 [Candidatus Acidoferrum sp.]|nr:hypothetical protein [Candidatus Acidoferrum sp.]
MGFTFTISERDCRQDHVEGQVLFEVQGPRTSEMSAKSHQPSKGSTVVSPVITPSGYEGFFEEGGHYGQCLPEIPEATGSSWML